MKILSIRLKNLASLSGEHFIDFESEPLASAGLVAIVGKTGAGKSTILDAMCLALFNKIPRLKDSDGKLQDVDGSELLTNSPLTVLRRGTAHGFAELTFIAQDQKHYLARWELKRSREKADGKLQSVQRYLKCLTDGVVVADKTKTVDASILKITQLSFEQFTRAVLLAQSEVTAFLKARDNERGELLEYLTNSSIFGKIGQLAFERTKAVAVKRKELENLLGHIEVLSNEQVAEYTIQFQQADREYKNLDTEKSQFEKQQLWFERQQKLQNEITLKQQLVHSQLKIQQELAPEQTRLKRLEIFSSIRPSVFQQQQFLKAEQQITPQIQKQQQLFDVLNLQFENEKQQFTKAETDLHQQQKFENTHREALDEVRKCIQEREFFAHEYKKMVTKRTALESVKVPLINQQHALEQQIKQLSQQQIGLNQQLTETAQFTPLDKGLTTHTQQLGQFIQQYQNIENQLGHQTQAEQKLIEQKNQLTQSITEFGDIEKLENQLEDVRIQREQKIVQLNQFDGIQQKLATYFEVQAESKRLNDLLIISREKSQSLEKDTVQAEQDYQTAKIERLKLQDILQQQRLLHAENIEHLRSELQDGEPCLVCGSTAHPYKVDDSAVSKALFELQQQQEQQAIQKEQETLQKWQVLQQQFSKLNAELEQYQLSIQKNAEREILQKNLVNEQVKNVNVQINLAQEHKEVHLQCEHVKQQYQTDIQQLETQSKTWMHSIKLQQQLSQNIQQTEHLLQSAQQMQSQIEPILNCLNDDEKSTWFNHRVATAQQILGRLNQRIQHIDLFEKMSKQLDVQNQQLKTLSLNIENTTQQIADVAKSLNEIKVRGQENTETANRLILQMTGLTDIKPNEWLSQFEQNRQQIQTQYQQVKQGFETLRADFEQQKNQLDQLKAQLQQNQSHANQVNVEIQNWLEQHTDFNVDDLVQLAQISPAQEQQIRQQLQNAERLLNEASSALKTMQEQLTEHKIYQPEIEFDALQQNILNTIEALKAQTEIRDQFKLKIEMHQQNLAKQQQYADQITEIQQEEHRWGKISGLMGDATGKKFRDYAQQYNLDILLEHANQQLSMLSQRYTLKRLENSLSLAIIDHDMDGETRSVASLSGGESFLTALALSLAIANMASGSMKIESLFIDEGFGTLDASSLHMVMNALDQLQNQGRKVVLISHIQEMHERIPVQIQVRPLGAGASTIEVVS